MNITLVGLGMGTPDTLTLDGCAALVRAEAVIGAARLLEDLPDGVTANRLPMIESQSIAAWVQAHDELAEICVLFSGDTGFYSGATALYPLLTREGHTVEMQPGIASPVYLCAKLGMPWQDVHLVSAHGRQCDPLAHVLNYPQVFFLTDRIWPPGQICSAIANAGLSDVEVVVGERLSYPDERITHGKVGEIAGQEFAPLSVLLVHRQTPTFCRASRASGIADSEFQRGEVPMTKREARAVILSMLAPTAADILWDIGAGTGSVAVEMALLARWGRVFAVDRNPEACALVNANRERFGLYNLCCLEGAVPDACARLDTPDAVFIGGSGGHLEEVVSIALERNPAVRIVISAVTIETMMRGMAALEKYGCTDIEAVQVSASRAQMVGSSHLLRAQNPIFIMGGRGSR